MRKSARGGILDIEEMMTKTKRQTLTDVDIDAVFKEAWEEFGDDKSTEFLIAITADRLGISSERVVDALANTPN